ncbi:GAF sensor protein [Halococcus salifodinae DSM 8989]|uniref:GAF sensor protein n=2 Tax=Halococcus salifodinae TaxID=36738 RepID=M0N5H7_9EURY|nr:GAF domain-containing protein [Halococcus salifodinae]EMA53172.1 GAF sensor protein [Halococcus salifodinae DSM 8989]
MTDTGTDEPTTMNDEETPSSIAPKPDEGTRDALQNVVAEFGCTSGTLHRKDEDGLQLVASVGIPDSVLSRIETIPVGKGMAGLAAERMEPVDVCNLQTDDSGVAEDGARATGMEGSLAAPIIGEDGTLEGTIGVGKPEQYEFTAEERQGLMSIGKQIVSHDNAE